MNPRRERSKSIKKEKSSIRAKVSTMDIVHSFFDYHEFPADEESIALVHAAIMAVDYAKLSSKDLCYLSSCFNKLLCFRKLSKLLIESDFTIKLKKAAASRSLLIIPP